MAKVIKKNRWMWLMLLTLGVTVLSITQFSPAQTEGDPDCPGSGGNTTSGPCIVSGPCVGVTCLDKEKEVCDSVTPGSVSGPSHACLGESVSLTHTGHKIYHDVEYHKQVCNSDNGKCILDPNGRWQRRNYHMDVTHLSDTITWKSRSPDGAGSVNSSGTFTAHASNTGEVYVWVEVGSNKCDPVPTAEHKILVADTAAGNTIVPFTQNVSKDDIKTQLATLVNVEGLTDELDDVQQKAEELLTQLAAQANTPVADFIIQKMGQGKTMEDFKRLVETQLEATLKAAKAKLNTIIDTTATNLHTAMNNVSPELDISGIYRCPEPIGWSGVGVTGHGVTQVGAAGTIGFDMRLDLTPFGVGASIPISATCSLGGGVDFDGKDASVDDTQARSTTARATPTYALKITGDAGVQVGVKWALQANTTITQTCARVDGPIVAGKQQM